MLSVGICRGSGATVVGLPTTFRVTQLASTDCEVILDGEVFPDWSAGDGGEITIQMTVDTTASWSGAVRRGRARAPGRC